MLTPDAPIDTRDQFMQFPLFILMRYNRARQPFAPILMNGGRGFGPIIEGTLEAARASADFIVNAIVDKGLTGRFVGEWHGAHIIASPEEFGQLIAAIRRYDPDTVGFYSNLQAESYGFTSWKEIYL
jgi:hypothetical protein